LLLPALATHRNQGGDGASESKSTATSTGVDKKNLNNPDEIAILSLTDDLGPCNSGRRGKTYYIFDIVTTRINGMLLTCEAIQAQSEQPAKIVLFRRLPNLQVQIVPPADIKLKAA